MLRKLTERTMGVRSGEQRFSKEMRQAFFEFDTKPLVESELISGARVETDDEGQSQVCLDLVYKMPAGEDRDAIERRKSVMTTALDNPQDAEALVDDMNDPANLARANRALKISGGLRDGAIVTGVGASLLVASVALDLKSV